MPRRRQLLGKPESLIAEAMGRLAERWGLKKNLGRIWAVLYLNGRPTTAAELQGALGLSTGAVSMTLRELSRWGVIRRAAEGEDRKKRYVAEVDVWRVVSRIFRARELSEVESAIDVMEQALAELRRRRDEADSGRREALTKKIRRVEGLLDLLRIVASLLRGLIATARLDATTLASYRLGGED